MSAAVPSNASQSRITNQIGEVLMSSAVTPDGISRSAHVTPPLPITSKQSADDGAGSPVRQRGHRCPAIAVPDEQHRSRKEEACRGHEERRKGLDAEPDRKIGRSPDDVDHQEGRDDLER